MSKSKRGRIMPLDWPTYTGQTVQIYRNLNNGMMSIQAKVNGAWKVVGHVDYLVLEGVSFVVRESGRQRVIREGQKNVHAFACGVLIAQFQPDLNCPIVLAYNPYHSPDFVQRGTGQVIVQCHYLVVRSNVVTVSPDALNLVPLIGGQNRRKQQRDRPAQLPLFWRPTLAWGRKTA